MAVTVCYSSYVQPLPVLQTKYNTRTRAARAQHESECNAGPPVRSGNEHQGHGSRGEEHHEGNCFCEGSKPLIMGLRILKDELFSAAEKRKGSVMELIKKDEYRQTRKRSAFALVKERAKNLTDEHLELSRAHDKACATYGNAHSKKVEAERNLATGKSKNVGPDLMICLQQVQCLTTMLERGCLNNVKRYAEKMLMYEGRSADCKEEVLTVAKELQELESELSLVTPRRNEELNCMNAVIEFLRAQIVDAP